jgi:hypothetical protein
MIVNGGGTILNFLAVVRNRDQISAYAGQSGLVRFVKRWRKN